MVARRVEWGLARASVQLARRIDPPTILTLRTLISLSPCDAYPQALMDTTWGQYVHRLGAARFSLYGLGNAIRVEKVRPPAVALASYLNAYGTCPQPAALPPFYDLTLD